MPDRVFLLKEVTIDMCMPNLYTVDDLRYVAELAAQNAVNHFVSKSADLDNSIPECISFSTEKDICNMKRIKKRITINGEDRWITAESEQEYAEKVAMAFFQNGVFQAAPQRPPTSHPFREYAQNWLDIYEKPHIARVTAVNYQRLLDNYLARAFGSKSIESITTDDLQLFFNSIKSKSIETVNKIKNILNMIFRRAVDEEIIQRNPLDSDSLRVTGERSRKTEAYSVEDMKFFASRIMAVEHQRDRAWFALMLFHPLRLEECLGLKHKDIIDSTMHINATVTHPTRSEPVYAEKTKTDKSRRVLEISPTALQYLYSGPQDTFVVYGQEDPTQPMSYMGVRRMCDRIARQIGYDDAITPRRFRTTVASDLYAATKDVKLVQNALGHSRFSQVALDHYIECRQSADSIGKIIDSVYT